MQRVPIVPSVFHTLRIEGEIEYMSTGSPKTKSDVPSGGMDRFFTRRPKPVAMDWNIKYLREHHDARRRADRTGRAILWVHREGRGASLKWRKSAESDPSASGPGGFRPDRWDS